MPFSSQSQERCASSVISSTRPPVRQRSSKSALIAYSAATGELSQSCMLRRDMLVITVESIQSLIGNLFFFMPMQLGAREGGFLLVFSILSLAAAHGVYVSLGMRIRELVWSVLGLALIKTDREPQNVFVESEPEVHT